MNKLSLNPKIHVAQIAPLVPPETTIQDDRQHQDVPGNIDLPLKTNAAPEREHRSDTQTDQVTRHGNKGVINNQSASDAQSTQQQSEQLSNLDTPLLPVIRQILENKLFWQIETYGVCCNIPVGIEYMLNKINHNALTKLNELQNIAKSRLANNGWGFFSSFGRSSATERFYKLICLPALTAEALKSFIEFQNSTLQQGAIQPKEVPIFLIR